MTATVKVNFTVDAKSAADASIQADKLIANLCKPPMTCMSTAMIQAENLEIIEVHP
jgi:hypothetical protein